MIKDVDRVHMVQDRDK